MTGDLGLGLVLGLSACGSAAGAGTAGMAAIGAWKKKYSQNKPASFMLLAFVGAPLTQTIYGMIVMNRMYELAAQGNDLWGIGVLCGAAIGLSAYFQGKCGACAFFAFHGNVSFVSLDDSIAYGQTKTGS